MKKILNVIYFLFGILGGFLVSQLVYTVSTTMISTVKNGDYAYTGNVLVNILIGILFYMYVLKVIKSIINSEKGNIIQSKSEKINLSLFIVSLLGCSYFILNKSTTGDTPLFATIIIGLFSIPLVIKLYTYDKFYKEFYLAPIKLNNKKLDEVIVKENKKRFLFNLLGIITGIIFTISVVIIHKIVFSITIISDKEVNNVLRIIIILLVSSILLIIIDKVVMMLPKKKYNKNFKYYYTIKDYFVDSFHIVFTILSYVLFVYVLDINLYLALIYMLIIKVLVNKFIPPSIDPDIDLSKINFSYSHLSNSNWNKNSNDIKFGYLSNGTSYFSMDLGSGITSTTLTDKDGNKTDVTSFEITDNLEYKSIRKR